MKLLEIELEKKQTDFETQCKLIELEKDLDKKRYEIGLKKKELELDNASKLFELEKKRLQIVIEKQKKEFELDNASKLFELEKKQLQIEIEKQKKKELEVYNSSKLFELEKKRLQKEIEKQNPSKKETNLINYERNGYRFLLNKNYLHNRPQCLYLDSDKNKPIIYQQKSGLWTIKGSSTIRKQNLDSIVDLYIEKIQNEKPTENPQKKKSSQKKEPEPELDSNEDEDEEEMSVVEIEYDGKIYYHDENTDSVYDPETSEIVGTRVDGKIQF